MCRHIIATFIFIICSVLLTAQINPFSITEFKVNHKNNTNLNKNLPDSIDNSNEIYFPPLYNQNHPVCNQVVSSYYMMSYERNLLLNLSSAFPENQLSVYYPWNYNNGGFGWSGSSYLQVFEMLDRTGIPSVETFWGDDIIDSIQWISGYEKYHSAMSNRLDEIYSIHLTDWEGIETLKGWLHNHLGERSPGGVAAVLGGYNWLSSLPVSSPHAGETVLYQWGLVASHARVIVGYNDSIRFDYNGDGQFTKDIDINNDGIVDLRDSEFGAFKYAESYGTEVGNNGFYWAMYKSFAEEYGAGGILNNVAYIIKPKIGYEPTLTADIELEYPKRNELQIGIGIAKNNLPTEIVKEFYFPTFNYQGGPHPMQGNGEAGSENIEFSFDISEVLSHVDSGEAFRLYLIINHAQPGNILNGSVKKFVINDHTGDKTVSFENKTPVSISDYEEFPLFHDIELNFSQLMIVQDSLTDIIPNEYFEKQLSATGGVPPYKWKLINDWGKSYANETFSIPETAKKISPETDFTGDTVIDLPFEFPFGNSSTSKLRVSARGYIIPAANIRMTTYFRDNLLYILQSTPIIAPLPRDESICYPDKGDGIWMSSSSEEVWIYWKISEENMDKSYGAEYAACLNSDGEITFHYGNTLLDTQFRKLFGVSLGDRISYDISDNDTYPSNAQTIQYIPLNNADVSLSTDGLLSGQITIPEGHSIKVKVEDSKNQFALKDLLQKDTISSNLPIKQISLFPNPCFNGVKIQTNDRLTYTFELFDLNGRSLHKTPVQHNSYINLRG